LAIGDKRRTGNNDKTELLNIIGDVKGKTAILFDDIVDTAGSLTKIAFALKENGAEHIYAACVHGVLSGNAIYNLENSPIEELIISNSIDFLKRRKTVRKLLNYQLRNFLQPLSRKFI
jgi:ribose-phosphate pyrophosphokinase